VVEFFLACTWSWIQFLALQKQLENIKNKKKNNGEDVGHVTEEFKKKDLASQIQFK
jgi:hypothetical protein